jgi:hypothetical protein
MSVDVVPYPRDESGEANHETAVDEMLGRQPTPVNPIYFSDGTETLALASVNLESGSAKLAQSGVINPQTRECSLEQLWQDWVDGPLVFKRQRFLEVQEETFDTEREVAVDQEAVETLVDCVADLDELPQEVESEVESAVEAAEESLEATT